MKIQLLIIETLSTQSFFYCAIELKLQFPFGLRPSIITFTMDCKNSICAIMVYISQNLNRETYIHARYVDASHLCYWIGVWTGLL